MQEVLFVLELMEIQEGMQTVDIVDGMDTTTIFSVLVENGGNTYA